LRLTLGFPLNFNLRIKKIADNHLLVIQKDLLIANRQIDMDVKEAQSGEVASSTDGPEELINASGHKQELERNFSLLSLCAAAITTGNTWVALGGSIVFAISNGGPPGVIYEFIAASVFYWMIAACIAELASAMPTSAGGTLLTHIISPRTLLTI